MQSKQKQFSLNQIMSKSFMVIILSFFAFGCGESNNIVIDLEPTPNDPGPFFSISYTRETTQGSNGQIENVQLTLSHTIGGELVDYGNLSFGDVQIEPDQSIEGQYYAVMQTGISDHPFKPEFRFDGDELSFKSVQSSMIEDINVELQIPEVTYIINLTQGQTVNPNEDLSIEVNREIFGAQITLHPTPDPVGEPAFVIMSLRAAAKKMIIPASQLQLLQTHSTGGRYLLRVSNKGDFGGEIEVRGKNSDKTIAVPVWLDSQYDIDFVMEE